MKIHAEEASAGSWPKHIRKAARAENGWIDVCRKAQRRTQTRPLQMAARLDKLTKECKQHQEKQTIWWSYNIRITQESSVLIHDYAHDEKACNKGSKLFQGASFGTAMTPPELTTK
jgi:hypothetical protein